MKLIYHPLSPFSRKVYILALELHLTSQITLEKVVVAPVFYPGWSDNNDHVAAAGNPAAKIPTLVVDAEDFVHDDTGGREKGGEAAETELEGVGIFDSKFICEYLIQRAGKTEDLKTRKAWQEKATHAACDGMMDAEVLVVYEERLREPQGLRWEPWVLGMREKVTRGFDLLERMARMSVIRPKRAEESVNVAEIAAAVCLSFFDVRKVEWRKGRAALEAFYKSWEGRESFVRAVSTREADWERAVL